MIFTPFLLFGHTWEYDDATKTITALIDRNTFYKIFVKNSDFLSFDDSSTSRVDSQSINNLDFVSIEISIYNIAKRQLKLTYKMSLISGQYILSQPLSKKEKLVLHKFRLLCYQYQHLEMEKPQIIVDLENKHSDSLGKHSIMIDGIDDENIVIHLYNYILSKK